MKLKWQDHLNTSWVSEGGEVVTNREHIKELYERLLTNQEVILMPQQILHLKGPPLPDVDREPLSQEEQEYYLNALLNSQLALARAVCADSPFFSSFKQRVLVLHRIYSAVSQKYHERDRPPSSGSREDKGAEVGGTHTLQDR